DRLRPEAPRYGRRRACLPAALCRSLRLHGARRGEPDGMTMSFTHTFHPTTLREYDIRGTIGRTLSEADAFAVGRVFGAVVARQGGLAVALGYDGRLSSPALEAAVAKGLSASGIEAIRIGRGPTPMLYYASAKLGTDGAVMVTGSHNPPDHNGFKMILA